MRPLEVGRDPWRHALKCAALTIVWLGLAVPVAIVLFRDDIPPGFLRFAAFLGFCILLFLALTNAAGVTRAVEVLRRPPLRSPVFITTRGRACDDRFLGRLQDVFSADMRSNSQHRAGTTIEVACNDSKVTTYTDGTGGYRTSCTVKITTTGTSGKPAIRTKKFAGSPPPSSFTKRPGQWVPGAYGTDTSTDIAAWLKAFPKDRERSST
jgi:hypothetical protein